MPPRTYTYVGPSEIRDRQRQPGHRVKVEAASDLLGWLAAQGSVTQRRGSVAATFIIDLAGRLWIADRHSEHVACANGEHVLAAGEIVFERHGERVVAAEVTNQSTGYCPEPVCWEMVARVLDRLEITRPDALTVSFEFRRCEQCGAINLIKDEVFECAVCDAPLSSVWNFTLPQT